MIGTAMALLALIMIPLGFALAWGMVRMLDSRADRSIPDPGASRVSVTPHPSTLPQVPLDDAPSDVIAAVAHRVAAGAPRRPDSA